MQGVQASWQVLSRDLLQGGNQGMYHAQYTRVIWANPWRFTSYGSENCLNKGYFICSPVPGFESCSRLKRRNTIVSPISSFLTWPNWLHFRVSICIAEESKLYLLTIGNTRTLWIWFAGSIGSVKLTGLIFKRAVNFCFINQCLVSSLKRFNVLGGMLKVC